MRVVLLPLSAPEALAALGRQIPAFVAEQLRSHAQAEVNDVRFMSQVQGEQGQTHVAYVAIPDESVPYEQIKGMLSETEASVAVEGQLRENDGQMQLEMRFFGPDSESAFHELQHPFRKEAIFTTLHHLVKVTAAQVQADLPDFLSGESMEFGTDNADAFLAFLEGHDSLDYINRAGGAVLPSFSPQPAIDTLIKATEIDPDFVGPYQTLVQLARACAFYRIGTFEMLEGALKKLTEMVPDDFTAFFGLSEIYASVGDIARQSDMLEKSIQLEPNDPNLYIRLALVQINQNMPVNAERNLRKAIGMGSAERVAYDQLQTVLAMTNRQHEIPPMWKSLVDSDPNDADARAKYAASLIGTGQVEEGERAFEMGLEVLEDNTPLKRFYAPYLMNKGDLDRAMDFYEDCLDQSPNDTQLLSEYATVLDRAGREVDLPETLRNLIASTQDQNIIAQANARLIEVEQPKRVESVMNAQKQMEAGEFDAALSTLRPLKNWLADYWKMWALLSSAYNRTNQFTDAEDAAMRLVNMFPGCEPAYGELMAALDGQGRAEDAYRAMQFGMQSNRNSLPILVNLGLAAKKAGRPDESKAIARSIREAVGPNSDLDSVLEEMER